MAGPSQEMGHIHTNSYKQPAAAAGRRGSQCSHTHKPKQCPALSCDQLGSAEAVVVMRGDVAMGRMGRGHIVQAQ